MLPFISLANLLFSYQTVLNFLKRIYTLPHASVHLTGCISIVFTVFNYLDSFEHYTACWFPSNMPNVIYILPACVWARIGLVLHYFDRVCPMRVANTKFWTRIGFVRLFRYQHIGIGNVKETLKS